jgi:uncharacterized protein (UPF0332 family)
VRPVDFLQVADALLISPGRPSEAGLRRAASTVYYAIFHFVARESADLLIGGTGAARSKPAWVQTYRALEHGYCRAQCQNAAIMKKFPREIEDFANLLVELQRQRHLADYDPVAKFSKAEVMGNVNFARRAMKEFAAAAKADRRAFCAWVLLRAPRR